MRRKIKTKIRKTKTKRINPPMKGRRLKRQRNRRKLIKKPEKNRRNLREKTGGKIRMNQRNSLGVRGTIIAMTPSENRRKKILRRERREDLCQFGEAKERKMKSAKASTDVMKGM